MQDLASSSQESALPDALYSTLYLQLSYKNERVAPANLKLVRSPGLEPGGEKPYHVIISSRRSSRCVFQFHQPRKFRSFPDVSAPACVYRARSAHHPRWCELQDLNLHGSVLTFSEPFYLISHVVNVHSNCLGSGCMPIPPSSHNLQQPSTVSVCATV